MIFDLNDYPTLVYRKTMNATNKKDSLALDCQKPVCQIGVVHSNFSHQSFFLLALATTMVAAWSTDQYFLEH